MIANLINMKAVPAITIRNKKINEPETLFVCFSILQSIFAKYDVKGRFKATKKKIIQALGIAILNSTHIGWLSTR